MDRLWINPGSSLDFGFAIDPGTTLDPRWVDPGSPLDRPCTGSALDRPCIAGFAMYRHWIVHASPLRRPWIYTASTLDRRWIYHGSILSLTLIGTESTLVRHWINPASVTRAYHLQTFIHCIHCRLRLRLHQFIQSSLDCRALGRTLLRSCLRFCLAATTLEFKFLIRSRAALYPGVTEGPWFDATRAIGPGARFALDRI